MRRKGIQMTEKNWWDCVVDRQTAEKYKEYLRKHDIYFEPSECADNIYISLFASDEEVSAFNEWITKDLMLGSVS